MTKEQKVQIDDKKELDQEYCAFIKDAANQGFYFKDSLDWYIFRYVNPICDRTIVCFVAIVALIALFFLYQIIDKTFPLVEKIPIVVAAKDESLYAPMIKQLRDKKSKENVDEIFAKYLLSVYINDRESYDYRKSDINELNTKLNRIKNNSSFAEYRNFQDFMSKDNAASPIHNFGQNVYRIVEIKSVNFIRSEAVGYYNKITNFFAKSIANEAEIQFLATTNIIAADNSKKEVKESYLAKVKFSFAGINREAKSGKIDFSVESYKLYKVK